MQSLPGYRGQPRSQERGEVREISHLDKIETVQVADVSRGAVWYTLRREVHTAQVSRYGRQCGPPEGRGELRGSGGPGTMDPNFQITMHAARLQAEWSWQASRETRAVCAALKLYARARHTGRWRKLRALLSRRPFHLLDLREVERTGRVRGRRYAGCQTVPLARIWGSAERCSDFDDEFHPLHDHYKSRWLGLATAYKLGATLPPVQLIQAGGVYFVQDGHHRISVARALGQQAIDAEVIVWEMAGPLPWECTVAAEARTALCRPLGYAKPQGSQAYANTSRIRPA